jgi:hypothetical protein
MNSPQPLITLTQTSTEFQKMQRWVTVHCTLGVRLYNPCFYMTMVLSHHIYCLILIPEWGLPTQFNATDAFLYKWADSQKLAYSQGAGWIVSLGHPIPILDANRPFLT